MPRTKFEKILSDFNSEIANMLREGRTQTTIAKILGVTQPAISQYFSRVRGWGFVNDEFRERLSNLISELDIKRAEDFRISIMKLAIERYETDAIESSSGNHGVGGLE